MKILYFIEGMEPTEAEKLEAERLGTKMFRNALLAADNPPVGFEFAGKIPAKWGITPLVENVTPIASLPVGNPTKKPAKKPVQWKPNA